MHQEKSLPPKIQRVKIIKPALSDDAVLVNSLRVVAICFSFYQLAVIKG